MLFIGFSFFAILLIIGAPIWLSLTLPGVYMVFEMGFPISTIPQQFFNSVDKWILLAVPFFLFAGNLMTYTGPSKKLFQFVHDCVGHLPGGLAMAAVITSAIFGALSGSTAATVVAVGSMVIPQMRKYGYTREQSSGIVAVSGTLGQMIPPSIYMILFASLVQLSVTDLFLAGIVPGIVITIFLVIVAFFDSKKTGSKFGEKSSWKQRRKSFIEALPSLLMPIIVLGGIYSGIFTPTEAAAIAVLYVLLIGMIFYRNDLNMSNIRKCVLEAMKTTAIVYIILGGATLFAVALTYSQVPQLITEFVTSLDVSSILMMLLILLLFFIFGTFLDPIPILFITIPILYPTVEALGYHPIHFAILTIACMMVAQVTPPVGVSLFALSGHFKEDLGIVIRGAIPYIFALVAVVFVLLFIPWISVFLVT